MAKRALITGVTGQDGSYLAELLLRKGYEVFGLVRQSSADRHLERIADIVNARSELRLLSGDLADQASLEEAVKVSRPHEVYNLAAQSFVGVSWAQPEVTANITGLGVMRVFEAVRRYARSARIYQASSSEQFGLAKEVPQKESTPFNPQSPYGIAKTYAHYTALNYAESYGMFVCCGILFNHESPRRGLQFVTRKITDAAARIKLGLTDSLKLGNMNAHRDWGFAGDYVEAMWLMLQQESAGDYVIATGKTRTVREFVEAAFTCVGLDWEKYVQIDESLLRPAEVPLLVGDSSKAMRQLGWEPKITFEQLVEMMVVADHRRLTNDGR